LFLSLINLMTAIQAMKVKTRPITWSAAQSHSVALRGLYLTPLHCGDYVTHPAASSEPGIAAHRLRAFFRSKTWFRFVGWFSRQPAANTSR